MTGEIENDRLRAKNRAARSWNSDLIKDRNKTVITRTVTSAAVRYLEWRGCKPLETEVPICNGWVADVAGALDPTITELAALKFIKHRPKWNGASTYLEWWDASRQAEKTWWEAAKQVQQLMTVLVEVKTSRSDFQNDKKWSLKIPVTVAYLAIPKDLGIRLDKVPVPWGILEYNAVTEDVRLRRVPLIQDVTHEQQRDVVFQIAIRRDHHTRYARMREFRRGATIERNKEVSRIRMGDAMRAMASIVKGQHGSVEGALEYHNIKHFPDYELPGLQELWGQMGAAK